MDPPPPGVVSVCEVGRADGALHNNAAFQTINASPSPNLSHCCYCDPAHHVRFFSVSGPVTNGDIGGYWDQDEEVLVAFGCGIGICCGGLGDLDGF